MKVKAAINVDVGGPLVIDDLALSFESVVRVRESLKNWIKNEMQEGDAITDSAEAFYLMKQRGIEKLREQVQNLE